eukprot:558501-Amphidinium_carterae.1
MILKWATGEKCELRSHFGSRLKRLSSSEPPWRLKGAELHKLFEALLERPRGTVKTSNDQGPKVGKARAARDSAAA